MSQDYIAIYLQILKSLNRVPNLTNQLPLKFNLYFIQLPQNNLDLLIPNYIQINLNQYQQDYFIKIGQFSLSLLKIIQPKVQYSKLPKQILIPKQLFECKLIIKYLCFNSIDIFNCYYYFKMQIENNQETQLLNQFLYRLNLPISNKLLPLKFSSISAKSQYTKDMSLIHKIYQRIYHMNYQFICEEVNVLRQELLKKWERTIIQDKSIVNSLCQLNQQNVHKKIENVKLEKLRYQCIEFIQKQNPKTDEQRIIMCLENLQLFLFKLTEYYFDSYQLKDHFHQFQEKQSKRIQNQIQQFKNRNFNNYFKLSSRLKTGAIKIGSEIKLRYNSKKQQLKLLRKKSQQTQIKTLKSQILNQNWDLQNVSYDQKYFQENIVPKIISLYKQSINYFEFLQTQKKLLVICMLKNIKNIHMINKLYFLNETQLILVEQMMIQLSKTMKCEQQIKMMNEQFNVEWKYNDCQEILMILVSIFKVFQNWNYTSIRFILKILFRKFHDLKFGFSNYKILNFLQKLNLPPLSSIHSALIKNDHKKANLQIDLKSYQINVKLLNKKFQKVPMITFQNICNSSGSRVVTLCLSGFTSQEMFMKQSWQKLFKNFDGQIYALNWESKTSSELLGFSFNKLFTIAAAGIFGNKIGLIQTSIKTLMQSYKNNPFTEAFEYSHKTGELLAYLIEQIFPEYLINFVGFSLGTQLIKETISTMKKRDTTHLINKVILIGGVADKIELQQVYDKQSFQKINCYSHKDDVLKILYKIFKPTKQPCGLSEINFNQNINCTSFIQGHLMYRSKLDELKKRIEMESDVFYLYDK